MHVHILYSIVQHPDVTLLCSAGCSDPESLCPEFFCHLWSAAEHTTVGRSKTEKSLGLSEIRMVLKGSQAVTVIFFMNSILS